MRYKFIELGQLHSFTIAEPKDVYKSDGIGNGACQDDSNNLSNSTLSVDSPKKSGSSGLAQVSTYNSGAYIDGAWKYSLEILFFEFLKMFVPGLYDLIDTSIKPESKETELNELDFALINKRLAPDNKLLPKEAIKNKKPNKRIVDKLVKVKLENGEDAFLLVHIEVQSKVNSYAQQLRFATRMHEYHKLLTSKFIGYKFINIGVLLNSSGPAVNSKASNNLKSNFYSVGNKTSKNKNPNNIKASKSIDFDAHTTVSLDNTTHENIDYLIYRIKDILRQESTFKFPVIHLAKWLDREDELMDLAHSNPFAIIVLYQILALKHPNLQERKKAKLQTIRILQMERRFAYSKDLLNDLTRIMDRLIYLPENINNEFYKEVQNMGTTTEPRLISIFDVMARKEGLEEGLAEGQINMLLKQMGYKFNNIPDTVVERIKSASLDQIETWSLSLLNAKTIDDVFNS